MPPASVGHYASLSFVVIGREQKTAGRGWILDCRFEIGESIGHRAWGIE